MFAFLAINGYLLEADEDDAAETLLEAAVEPSDEVARSALAHWVAGHISKMEMTE